MPHENVHLQLSSVDKIFVTKFTSAWFNAVVVLFVTLQVALALKSSAAIFASEISAALAAHEGFLRVAVIRWFPERGKLMYSDIM